MVLLTRMAAPGCSVEIVASPALATGDGAVVHETFMRTAGSLIMGAAARRRRSDSELREGEAVG